MPLNEIHAEESIQISSSSSELCTSGEFFPHNEVHRACEKEQRRRMLDFYGPEKTKRSNAHHVARIHLLFTLKN